MYTMLARTALFIVISFSCFFLNMAVTTEASLVHAILENDP